jgi:hypothetical protein
VLPPDGKLILRDFSYAGECPAGAVALTALSLIKKRRLAAPLVLRAVIGNADCSNSPRAAITSGLLPTNPTYRPV